MIEENPGKGVYILENYTSGRVFKKVVNICLLKEYFDSNISHSSF